MFANDQGDFFGYPVASAGGGALAAGLICLIGLGEGRTLVLPPVVVGAVFLAVGLLLTGADFDQDVVLTVALALVVLAGSVFPWLALGVTGTSVDQLYSPADITADPDEIRARRVASDARVAHEILVAISATVGLMLVLISPLAVRLGIYGTLLAVVCSLDRDAAHPAVPHRRRGDGRPRVRHPRPGLGGRVAPGLPRELAPHDRRSSLPRPVPCCSRSRCCRRPPPSGVAASATSRRPSPCSRSCRCW